MKHYVIISSDCHAGPNSPVYRGYLDPEFRADFDDELAERQALIDARRAAAGLDPFTGDDEFKEEWFGEDEEGNSLHEIGMRGYYDLEALWMDAARVDVPEASAPDSGRDDDPWRD